ncbi:MAG: ribonuclease H-like domain-containing protein [Lachnospiraceae bacterium]|nr:ribonuclease H-like domain-containing protein [Lachnospiraceae bacterium]
MKVINYQISCDNTNRIPIYYQHFYPDSRLLFFDIETTGFLAQHTTLYLIGVLWYESDNICIRQWFNDDGKSEAELLSAFVTFCKQYTHLVHFNGNGFDLPYIKNKGELLKIDTSSVLKLQQLDIYKIIRSYKEILCMEHMKQVNLEEFLEIERTDCFHGGELISVYQKFIVKQDALSEHNLLLHNRDDLLGMPKLSEILCYPAFFEQLSIKSFSFEKENDTLNLTMHTNPECHLPKRISIFKNGFYLNAMGEKALLQIPITKDTLKYYYGDYKNYYYLPLEDYAIHKSVASYVSSSNRVKATRDTCYIKRRDIFIPCFESEHPEQFAKDRKEKERYQLLSSLQQADIEGIERYVRAVLAKFINSK